MTTQGRRPPRGGPGFSADPEAPEELYSGFDRLLGRMHALFTGRHKVAITLLSWAVYAALVVAAGPALEVSSNYLIILPLLATSMSFGLPGGLMAGAFGLPANLALFHVIGRPEFSPASKPIAELAGLVLGSALGYLSDFYRKLERERALRVAIERELREALSARDLLFKELNHRVKNNLNLVLSIISLQERRAATADLRRELGELSGRVKALSLVHDQLYRKADISAVDVRDYLKTLSDGVRRAVGDPRLPPFITLDCPSRELPMELAAPLGLIVNEALTNAFKHAGGRAEPLRIELRLGSEPEALALEIADDGNGALDAPAAHAGSLGIKLIEGLAGQLGGGASYSREGGRTVFRLRFPVAP